jgi:hypothetical protein
MQGIKPDYYRTCSFPGLPGMMIPGMYVSGNYLFRCSETVEIGFLFGYFDQNFIWFPSNDIWKWYLNVYFSNFRHIVK